MKIVNEIQSQPIDFILIYIIILFANWIFCFVAPLNRSTYFKRALGILCYRSAVNMIALECSVIFHKLAFELINVVVILQSLILTWYKSECAELSFWIISRIDRPQIILSFHKRAHESHLAYLVFLKCAANKNRKLRRIKHLLR